MHDRLQFGMRENPASNRRHGSRSVAQEHSFAAASTHGSHQQGIIIGSDSGRPAQGLAAVERRVEAEHSISVAQSIKALCNTWTNNSTDQHAVSRTRRTGDDAEFEPLLDLVEEARLLRLNPKTLQVIAGHGVIVGIQIGGVRPLRASMLNRWLEEITDSRGR